MDPVETKFQTVKDILEGNGPRDIHRAASLILDLKKELVKHKYLTPQEADCPTEMRVRFRDILEFDALVSIRSSKLEEFERAIAQLKCYYFRAANLPPSHRMPLLLSIHLVHLLARKRIVEFNIELQLIRAVIGHADYIEYATNLHESIINTSFSRLSALEKQMPSELFRHFTAELLDGARNNHADSIERAYRFLTLEDLAKILHFDTIDEARQFAARRLWRLADDGATVFFDGNECDKGKVSVDMLARSVELSTQISALA
jgi:26S proteasome regulatory subunit N12